MSVAAGVVRDPVRPRARHLPASPISRDMATMINRVVGGYAVVGLAPGVPELLEQAPLLARPWLLALLVLQPGIVIGMLVQAGRRRPVRRWAAAFSLVTLLAVVTFASAAPPSLTSTTAAPAGR